ncbi:hypothetical protein GDO81_028029 [Engystomops pustulosus]|uniref:TIL domain-containing protein n=1 Tax=Engystomops pustulosus TaxID=76066 RepID=A0AAV6ZNR9_ENGPU|nr:hypothetical protein GDO81_028029 [Engystomops pustulosus]
MLTGPLCILLAAILSCTSTTNSGRGGSTSGDFFDCGVNGTFYLCKPCPEDCRSTPKPCYEKCGYGCYCLPGYVLESPASDRCILPKDCVRRRQ